ncbi:MAG: hypothetical protein WD960_10680 [Gemmatimonadota bacterium]
MPTPRRLYLHIGLPKTATTYLQQQVFGRLALVQFLEKPRSALFRGTYDTKYGVLDRCFKRSVLVWRERGDEVFRELLRSASEPKDLLISDEGIGTAARKPHSLRAHLEAFTQKAVEWGFGSVRVFCAVRRQDQWLGSHYAQISDRIRGASQASFEAFVSDWLDPAVGYYRDGVMLDYKALRDQIVLAVGEPHTLMLPHELLVADPQSYLHRVAAFLEAEDDPVFSEAVRSPEESNVRSAGDDVWQIRRRTPAGSPVLRLRPGRLFRQMGLPTSISIRAPDLRRGKRIEMTAELKQAILQAYATRNQELAESLGMDLRPYGYHS